LKRRAVYRSPTAAARISDFRIGLTKFHAGLS
jgi:hypothetical protein